MFKSIVAAAVILLSASEEGLARELVYGYYTSLFADEETKPPPEISFPIFPPEIWKLILQDLSVLDLASIAQTCRGLEKITRQIDRSYIPRLAYQSHNLAFFKKYMLMPILGLKPPLSPLQDLYNMLRSYKAIYDSGYMVDVFTPEHVKAYEEAIKKIERGYRELTESSFSSRTAINDLLQAAKIFIFPFQYKNYFGEPRSIIDLCRPYQTDYYFESSFYYPLSSPQALWGTRLYINQHWLLLLSKAKVIPQLSDLRITRMMLPSVPPWLPQMPSLVNLYLENADLSKLPMELSKLQNLECLGLGWNKFTNIPPVIGTLTKLDDLDLGYNLLKDLDTDVEYLKPLTNLNRLILWDNRITNINFLSQLTHLTNLEILRLSSNTIHSIPEWIISLRGPNNKKLTIDLHGNSFRAAFIRDWLTPQLLPSAKQRLEYNSNPKVEIITD